MTNIRWICLSGSQNDMPEYKRFTQMILDIAKCSRTQILFGFINYNQHLQLVPGINMDPMKGEHEGLWIWIKDWYDDGDNDDNDDDELSQVDSFL